MVFSMNNNALSFASILLFLSSSVVAMDNMNQYDKSGHTIYVGISKMSGDLSRIGDDTAFSFGYDYTTKNGIIIGGYYTPKLLSASSSYSGISSTLDSKVLGVYSGYQFNNNFRFTTGFSFTDTKATIATSSLSASDSENNVGFMLGADYLFNNQLIVGARISTHDVGSVNGTTIGINVGYKF